MEGLRCDEIGIGNRENLAYPRSKGDKSMGATIALGLFLILVIIAAAREN